MDLKLDIMDRKQAKKMAQSRDCHCVNSKDRDSNFNEIIDKVFDWHESEMKKIKKNNINNSLNLSELEEKLNKALDLETRGSLIEWLNKKRSIQTKEPSSQKNK
jgi:hypothetical protein